MVPKKKSKYYISLQEATKFCDYSQEYLSLRARQGKLKSKKLGRNWVTTEDWLKIYLATVNQYESDIKQARSDIMSEPPADLPVEKYFPAKIDDPRTKKSAFLFAALALVLAAGILWGSNNNLAKNVFKDYGRWLVKTTNLDTVGKEFSAYGQWVRSGFSGTSKNILVFFKSLRRQSVSPLTKEDLIEVEEQQTKTIIDKFMEELQKLGVKKVTEIQPVKEVVVKEVVRETIKVSNEELERMKQQMVYLEDEISKRLFAPGGVITQPIYVKEPVSSPKVYQENGNIVLQTLGSGNVMLSAATGLQLYGKQVVIESTSLLNPLIYLASDTRINGDLTVTGSISGGQLSLSSFRATGDASFGGNITVAGSITVDGYLTSNATITAAAFVSGDSNSTVRKSGEEVLREMIPISRYDIPAQTATTSYFRISKSFDQNPLTSTPEPLPGATRVYKLIIKYDDNIPANSSSSWRIYRPTADTTADSFILLGRNSSQVKEGIATTTSNLAIPDTDWQVDVKLSAADVGKALRIFQIFLAAFDRIN